MPLHLTPEQPPLERKTLKAWRESRGWTQAMLSEESRKRGYPLSITSIIRAEREDPISNIIIARLALTLGIKEEQLLIVRITRADEKETRL